MSAKVTYEPVDKKDAAEQIAVGVHTGLRKGSEAPSSAAIWQIIANNDDGAWMDAVKYCVWGMEHMGYVICKKVES